MDPVEFEGADLSDERLIGADLFGSRWTRTRADRASLEDARLGDWYASRCSLVDANLDRAYLIKAQLWHVDLAGASLRGARMLKLDGTHLDLTNADLSGADLTAATITQSDFTNVRWDGAFVTEDTVLQGHAGGRVVEGLSDLGLRAGPDPRRPRPTSDFPVTVTVADGVYVATLNGTVEVAFAPEVEPRLEPYVVTAGDVDPDLPHTVVRVSAREFEALIAELDAIGRFRSRSGQPLSQITGPAIKALLSERIPYADADRAWLTD